MEADAPKEKTAWHALSADQVLEKLRSSAKEGLSEQEASERLRQYGQNVLPEAKKPSQLLRFFKQFNNVLIYILLVAAGLTLSMGHYVDTIVILAVVVINALIGFIQENRAEKAMDAIRNILALAAHVVRGGKRMEVEAQDLTPGDIVRLKPGDKVPADLRLITANNLKIEESALTGEAEAADKQIGDLPEKTGVGDRTNMAFSSSTVSTGSGTGVVVEVGQETQIGGINQLLADTAESTTPLLRQMDRLSKNISIVILIIAVGVYLFGRTFRDYEPGVLALSVIGLAIGAIPEGLPAIMSIILAIGVQSMAKRHAIVRDLPSVETLGSVSVICSDKTGTLTKNEMTTTDLATRDNEFTITGSGYEPKGEILHDGAHYEAGKDKQLSRLLQCFRICNESELAESEGRWIVRGEPTEGALVAAFDKSGLSTDGVERIDVLPFDSKYKYMAVQARVNGEEIIFIKGAPDRILAMANEEDTSSGRQPLDENFWTGEINRLAGQEKRTIAAACKKAPSGIEDLQHDHLSGGMVFLGLAGIVDPPREEAIAAVKECQLAGITVKMITGDHAQTALAIGCQMGIGDGEHALTGAELDAMDEKQLQEAVGKYHVFARTSPENKLQLVQALQSHRDVDAMTGAGVYDAPALKIADVGIAMGIKETEVTKDAAKIVLTDDNFSTIAAAVEEGRKVYDNLKKTILFILPTNGAECFLIMASILFGTILPLTPVQILWVNMVTSVTVSLALAFEPLDPAVMEQPPRNPDIHILDAYFLWRIFYVSVLIGGACLILAVYLTNTGRYSETLVRTITMQAIILCQMFHLFNNRSLRRSAFCCGLFTNKAIFVVGAIMIVLQLSITYLPFMNRIFGTAPLPAVDWLYPFALGAAIFAVVEIEKWIMRLVDSRKASRSAQARPIVRDGNSQVTMAHS